MERLNKVRSSFWFYDVFGYLIPGFFFICLIIIDYDVSTLMRFSENHNGLHELLITNRENVNFKLEYLFRFLSWNQTGNDFKFTPFVLLILFCYIIGHLVSAISSLVIETWFNKGIFGFPSHNLFGIAKNNWLKRRFKNYTKPFNSDFIDMFKKIYLKRFGKDLDPNDSFWMCFSDVSRNSPIGFERATHFLSLYGFNRNIATSFFIYIILRIIVACPFILNSSIDRNTIIILVLFFSFGLIMTKNYLKLFRRQCTEVYYQFYAANTEEKKETVD